MPEFVESPPPLPPKDIPDIPEYAVPHKVKQQLKQQQEKQRLEQLEAEEAMRVAEEAKRVAEEAAIAAEMVKKAAEEAKKSAEPDAMTVDEAENLLSTRFGLNQKFVLAFGMIVVSLIILF